MPIPISLSGLLSAQTRLQVAADNIANSQTTSSRSKRGFTPKVPISQPLEDGGVRTEAVPKNPASKPLFAPRSPLADENGFVEAPNVSLAEEIVRSKQAVLTYKANAEVLTRELGTIDDLLETLGASFRDDGD